MTQPESLVPTKLSTDPNIEASTTEPTPELTKEPNKGYTICFNAPKLGIGDGSDYHSLEKELSTIISVLVCN